MIDYRRQKGVVLAVSLIVLVLLTLLALTAMRGTLLEQRMAANLKNRAVAFQAAETALRDGEHMLAPMTRRPPTCASPPCPSGSIQPAGVKPVIDGRSVSWWQIHGRAATQAAAAARPPRFVITPRAWQPDDRRATCTSYSDTCSGRLYYAVTARATGTDDTSVTVLRSVYAKRFH